MICETVQKYFAMLGISASQSIQKHPFNIQNLAVSCVFGITIIDGTIYIFHVADTFKEYTEAVYFTSTTAINASIFASFVWKMSKMFESVDYLEDIIQKSESTNIE